ncbi:hypothetical protein Leryth_012037 [Lithospermum erythrorhizon]|nr:hypothetical protein Leryth_012037 [Lithospermum erythrorhizon]
MQEQKKPEEPKKADAEEKKEEAPKAEPEKPTDEKKGDEAPAPPPPQEIVLKIYMHCEGCAKKVRKSLKGFEGVENVSTDCKTHKVIVKGEKAHPLKVLERLQRKSRRQVELLSPIPKPPPPEEPKKQEEKQEVKPEEKKEEPQVITAILSVHMHCEACAQEIRKRIQRMKGVESAATDQKSSQVTVKGVFDPLKLVDFIRKRSGKQATIVKVEPEKKEEEKPKENADEKKEEGAEKEAPKGGAEGDGDKKEGGGDGGGDAKKDETPPPQPPQMELRKNEIYYYHPQHFQQQYYQPRHVQDYPPQIFSDENPNACSVM